MKVSMSLFFRGAMPRLLLRHSMLRTATLSNSDCSGLQALTACSVGTTASLNVVLYVSRAYALMGRILESFILVISQVAEYAGVCEDSEKKGLELRRKVYIGLLIIFLDFIYKVGWSKMLNRS